ncbi:hypothetical protein [Parapedobacter koreensis]|uniref:Uncharacterized protein n=1 Tax=Parapedobacter koreensis TaxID=332977 RepID=A0A1H7GPS6_9SPHI|nr:hypothetical protein [Parapedobacter koreensis]SEK40156.1 hypothetical protein SAMN05421740_101764 [Parapedobacter koreensis]
METLKFETAVGASSQLAELSHIMDSIPNIIDWCIDRFTNYVLLSVKGINIRATDIINTLDGHGIHATQLYEE